MRVIKNIDFQLLDAYREPYKEINRRENKARWMYMFALGSITAKMKGYQEDSKAKAYKLNDKILDVPADGEFLIEDAEAELIKKCIVSLDLEAHMEVQLLNAMVEVAKVEVTETK